MRENFVCTAADAIYKLAAGNLKYLNAENGSGDGNELYGVGAERLFLCEGHRVPS